MPTGFLNPPRASTDPAAKPAQSGSGVGPGVETVRCRLDALQPFGPSQSRMMPGKRSKGNPDPLRASAPDVRDSAAAAVIQPSFQTLLGDDWRNDAGSGAPGRGRRDCNTDVRGHSGRR